MIQSVYWLGILINILFGLLYVGLFSRILNTVFPSPIFEPKVFCSRLSTAKKNENMARAFMILFVFTTWFLSIVILLDAYRRLLNCGRADLAISAKKMAMQFGALLFLGLAELYITFKYIIILFHPRQQASTEPMHISVWGSAISYFIMIWSLAPVIYIIYSIQRTSDQNDRVAANNTTSQALTDATYPDMKSSKQNSFLTHTSSTINDQEILMTSNRYGSMSEADSLRGSIDPRSSIMSSEHIQFLNILVEEI